MNEALFYAGIRKDVFKGRMTQAQVDGVAMILDVGKALPAAQIAYVLATSFWETGRKMQPVREIGRGKGRSYGKPAGPYGHVYYGRGDVQLTWLDNYRKAGGKLGIDLVQFPDRALENRVSKMILISGMIEGWFAGDKAGRHTLDRWIRPERPDFIGARRIINGTDKRAEIADIASRFLAALQAAGWQAASSAPVPTEKPTPPPIIPPEAKPAPAQPPAPEPDFPPAPEAPSRWAMWLTLAGLAFIAIAYFSQA